VLSGTFSEGQSRDINEEFPTDSSTTEVYDYLSDSDLEDEYPCSEEDYAESTEGDNAELPPSPQAHDSGPQTPMTTPLERSPENASEVQGDNGLASVPPWPPAISD
jgi:hypothetical protein